MKIIPLSLLLVGLFMTCTAAYAAYPEKPITMIIPVTAGSHQDIVARTLAPTLEKELGAKIIVKNIGGAGGTLGAAEVSKAAPDGYTIGYLSIASVTLQPQVRTLPYKTDSFTPISCVNSGNMMLLVKGDSPLNTAAEAQKLAEDMDGKAIFGSYGPGSITHIASVALFDTMGVKVKHMPEVGGAEAVKNLISGHTQFLLDTGTYINIYNLKALGLLGDKRDPDFPNVPTMKEQGYDLDFSYWSGVLAPKGVPEDIVRKLEKAVQTAVTSAEFKNLAKKNDIPILYMNSKDFGVYLAKQAAQGKEYIEKYNLRQD